MTNRYWGLKGPNKSAQGNALGGPGEAGPFALKGPNIRRRGTLFRPFRALSVQYAITQGVALGYAVSAFQATRSVLKYLLIACVLASILFAHGCHGNEDHELFGMAIRWLGK